jgi:hypothetical protein
MICFMFIWRSSEVSSFRVGFGAPRRMRNQNKSRGFRVGDRGYRYHARSGGISRCTQIEGPTPAVKPLLSPALAFLFAIVGAANGLAQEQTAGGGDSATAPDTANPLTGKERLGRKWMDEQRIDNCKVPTDKQGGRPRSSECPHVPTG